MYILASYIYIYCEHNEYILKNSVCVCLDNYTHVCCLQSIPPTEEDMRAVLREDSSDVLKEMCPPELASIDEDDVSPSITHTYARSIFCMLYM